MTINRSSLSSPPGRNEDPSSVLPFTFPLGSGPYHQGSSKPIAFAQESRTGTLSYAVAIYPYIAEQEDEFDAMIGDAFVITSRTKNWWVVQRDPDGRGLVETDPSKQGWVPAGCLLEVKIPVSVAIEEAANVTSSNPCNSPEQTPSLPILPFNILSTSHPGIGLMDYQKKGDEELNLQKDDALRVFKKYNYWSYAVKEGTGDRGWVPSSFIGKVTTESLSTPATPDPSTASSSPFTSILIDEEIEGEGRSIPGDM